MSSDSSSTSVDPHSEKSSLDPEATRENAQSGFEDVPDGGFQAWLQVAAAFFMFMNTAGLFTSYGVFQGFYTQGPLASISGSNIAWIGSLQGCLTLLVSIVTGPLYDLGYLYTLVNIGTFAIILGMMTTSICRSTGNFFSRKDWCRALVMVSCSFLALLLCLNTSTGGRLWLRV